MDLNTSVLVVVLEELEVELQNHFHVSFFFYESPVISNF